HLSENRNGVGIPFRQELAGLDFAAVFFLELCAIDDWVALTLPLAPLLTFRVVDDGYLAVAVHHDKITVLVRDGAHVDELDRAFIARLQGGLLRVQAFGCTSIERA